MSYQSWSNWGCTDVVGTGTSDPSVLVTTGQYGLFFASSGFSLHEIAGDGRFCFSTNVQACFELVVNLVHSQAASWSLPVRAIENIQPPVVGVAPFELGLLALRGNG